MQPTEELDRCDDKLLRVRLIIIGLEDPRNLNITRIVNRDNGTGRVSSPTIFYTII